MIIYKEIFIYLEDLIEIVGHFSKSWIEKEKTFFFSFHVLILDDVNVNVIIKTWSNLHWLEQKCCILIIFN